jgi:hypothetical protein
MIRNTPVSFDAWQLSTCNVASRNAKGISAGYFVENYRQYLPVHDARLGDGMEMFKNASSCATDARKLAQTMPQSSYDDAA